MARSVVAAAYQKAALASDPSSGTHQPPASRAPLGAIDGRDRLLGEIVAFLADRDLPNQGK